MLLFKHLLVQEQTDYGLELFHDIWEVRFLLQLVHLLLDNWQSLHHIYCVGQNHICSMVSITWLECLKVYILRPIQDRHQCSDLKQRLLSLISLLCQLAHFITCHNIRVCGKACCSKEVIQCDTIFLCTLFQPPKIECNTMGEVFFFKVL